MTYVYKNVKYIDKLGQEFLIWEVCELGWEKITTLFLLTSN